MMSFGRSPWCRSTPDYEHRSTDPSPIRSTGFPEHRSMTPTESTVSCNAMRILTHEEFAAKHPHPPNPDNEEKLQEGDFEVESLMSFRGWHWCRSTPDHEHRSMVPSPNRSIGSPEHRSMTPTESTSSCNAVRILTHEEFAAKHPHPSNPDNLRIARHDMPKIDVARLNALRLKPKPSDNPPETVRIPSDDGEDLMDIDRVPMGRTLRKRKEKVEKHLKRGANHKEKESFRKRVFRIPIDKPFEEAYYLTNYFIGGECGGLLLIDAGKRWSIDVAMGISIDACCLLSIDVWRETSVAC
ncbi:hypothetical protein F2Q70_00002944 [Brassica cretica]|uniref:Uncharacterized protein n=1 Tax=Brassica cretica TaxID=69181 RepID=A0A8S9IV45_BRACR|nr:hypothetical protein F2Q70_00002944 [Brassica cretica]